MEQNILATLQFNLNGPSPLHFLRRFSKAAGSDYEVHCLSKYLVELTVLDIKLLKYALFLANCPPAYRRYRPSQIAAGAVYVARKMKVDCEPTWNSTLEHYTEMSEEEVLQVAIDMNTLLNRVRLFGWSSLDSLSVPKIEHEGDQEEVQQQQASLGCNH